MYGEKIQEKGYDMPTSVHQPELNVIIEKLQSVVNRYDGIVFETRTKLHLVLILFPQRGEQGRLALTPPSTMVIRSYSCGTSPR